MPKTDFTFDDLKVYMNGEFREGIGEDMDKKLDNLTTRMDNTQQELKSHKAHVERELRNIRAEFSGTKPPPPTLASKEAAGDRTTSSQNVARADKESRQYWRSRRSSRFFPIS